MTLNLKSHVIMGNNAPSTPPSELMQHYFDQINTTLYISVGTSSINDWKEVEIDVDSSYFSPFGKDLLKSTDIVDLKKKVTLEEVSNIPAEVPLELIKPLMQVGAPAILDSERRSVEAASGGKKTVINGSIVYIIPKNTYENLGLSADLGTGILTAFDKGSGAIASEIFVGVYQTSKNSSGKLVSQPNQMAHINTNHSEVKSALLAQGNGCHLWTVHERAAVLLESKKLNYEPRGNTDYGRAHDNYKEVGRFNTLGGLPGDPALGNLPILTGSGPKEWNHDGTPNGISDLVGNVWEWCDGFKTIDGRFYINPNNDYSLPDDLWVAQNAYYNWTGTALQLSHIIDINFTDVVPRGLTNWMSVITKTASYISNQLAKRILMEPVAATVSKGTRNLILQGERVLLVGGGWPNAGASGGLSYISSTPTKHTTVSTAGSRLAFIL